MLSSAGLCVWRKVRAGVWGGGTGRARAGWESPLLSGSAGNVLPPRPSLSPTVSTYTNAFAITQFFGVLCAPWNGLLMDRLKQKYQKEAKGEAWAAEGRGTGRGGIFMWGQSHLLFCS